MRFDQLHDDALLGLKDLIELVPISRTTVWRLCRKGVIPPPVTITGTTRRAWRWRDLREWLAAQGAEGGAAE